MAPTHGHRGLASAAVASALLALLLLAPTARGQGAPTPHVLLGGGVAFPNGTGTDQFHDGYQLQGALELTSAGHPLALRVEALYSRFGFDCSELSIPGAAQCPPQGAHQQMLAGIVDAVLAPRTRTLPLVPYLVVGVGAYRHENNGVKGSSGTDLGLNGGAGLRIPALHAFVEARQHQVKDAPNYLPITLGIRF